MFGVRDASFEAAAELGVTPCCRAINVRIVVWACCICAAELGTPRMATPETLRSSNEARFNVGVEGSRDACGRLNLFRPIIYLVG